MKAGPRGEFSCLLTACDLDSFLFESYLKYKSNEESNNKISPTKILKAPKMCLKTVSADKLISIREPSQSWDKFIFLKREEALIYKIVLAIFEFLFRFQAMAQHISKVQTSAIFWRKG